MATGRAERRGCATGNATLTIAATRCALLSPDADAVGLVMSGFLFDSWIPGLILFSALYISDYTWTIANARLYRSKANQYIVFEGSFELTPYFQKDIDALRRVSPRFVLAFILMNGILAALWFIRRLVPGMEPMHMMFLGCIVLLQCTIHLRHFRTWHLFRSMRAPSGIVGRIEYRRPVILRASASEMFSFAGMWLLLAAVLGSWFFFGGAIQCAVVGVKHRLLAKKHPASVAAAST